MLSPFNTISPSIRNDRVEVFNDREKSLGFLAIVDAQVDYFLGKISSKHARSLYQFMSHPSHFMLYLRPPSFVKYM